MKKVQDHYFREAKQQGFAARSAYKLVEIDRKHKLLTAGMRVLDLGCAPGSWLQVAAQRVGGAGRVVGVDLQAVTLKLPSQVRTLVGDIDDLPEDSLRPTPEPETSPESGSEPGADPTAGPCFDVVLSDMAPRTTGIKQADAARSAALGQRVIEVADRLLKPGGHLLLKVFQGGDMPALRDLLREKYAKVTVEKPRASRSESVEVFLLGKSRKEQAAG